ncbi:kinetochore-associated Ndc80 complex subunit ndc80 [Perkinsus olseni]|uniref:Kinetochore-associated Ndc80 complex subunit ndc80 n=2 Tax=Perkinsus olseni TaxID=32597 RepID=A0A7J6MDK6_PEROL|nr:kinetochore-associated Ndc80 complex subunit ndc80 [Perkinsus olseni]
MEPTTPARSEKGPRRGTMNPMSAPKTTTKKSVSQRQQQPGSGSKGGAARDLHQTALPTSHTGLQASSSPKPVHAALLDLPRSHDGTVRIKDERPLQSKAYRKACAEYVYAYLSKHGYRSDRMKPGWFDSPSTREFFSVCEFLLERIDPNLIVSAPQKKSTPEDLISIVRTKLLYPYDVPKSALASVGAITTWPALLGLLSWLVEEAEETDRMKERVNSISDATRAREKALGTAYTAWVQAGQAQTLEETAMLDKIEGLIRAEYDELKGENEKCEKIIGDNDTAVKNIKDSGDLDDPEEYERKNEEIRGHVGEVVREVEALRRREQEASEDRQRWEQKTGKEKEKEQKLRDQINELTQRVDAQVYSHDDLAQLLARARRLDDETCQLQEQITQCDSDTISEETQARTEQHTLQGLCHEFNECIGTGGHPAIPRANFNPEAADFLKRTFGSLAAPGLNIESLVDARDALREYLESREQADKQLKKAKKEIKTVAMKEAEWKETREALLRERAESEKKAVADAEARLVELDKQIKHLHESSEAQKSKLLEDVATAEEEARELEELTDQSVHERKGYEQRFEAAVEVINSVVEHGLRKAEDLDHCLDDELMRMQEGESKPKASKRAAGEYEEATSRVRDKFLIEAPESFFLLWEACRKLNPSNPCAALEGIGLTLVGPFQDVAEASNLPQSEWRYFYDPPEVVTVVVDLENLGRHWAYYVDKPGDSPISVLVASRADDCKFRAASDSVLSLVYDIAREHEQGDRIASTIESLCHNKAELTVSLSAWKARMRRTQGTTFNGLGVLVPYDKHTEVGYRELPVSSKVLRGILDKIRDAPPAERDTSKLDEIFTWTNIGNDEGDFGMGLELGQDLFCADKPGVTPVFTKPLTTILRNAYNLLGRKAFVPVLEEHTQWRVSQFQELGEKCAGLAPGCLALQKIS